ncbi:MAG: Low-affinity gluconate/H+ symporter GntU, partial [uncultured Blastococcus sp.]
DRGRAHAGCRAAAADRRRRRAGPAPADHPAEDARLPGAGPGQPAHRAGRPCPAGRRGHHADHGLRVDARQRRAAGRAGRHAGPAPGVQRRGSGAGRLADPPVRREARTPGSRRGGPAVRFPDLLRRRPGRLPADRLHRRPPAGRIAADLRTAGGRRLRRHARVRAAAPGAGRCRGAGRRRHRARPRLRPADRAAHLVPRRLPVRAVGRSPIPGGRARHPGRGRRPRPRRRVRSARRGGGGHVTDGRRRLRAHPDGDAHGRSAVLRHGRRDPAPAAAADLPEHRDEHPGHRRGRRRGVLPRARRPAGRGHTGRPADHRAGGQLGPRHPPRRRQGRGRVGRELRARPGLRDHPDHRGRGDVRRRPAGQRDRGGPGRRAGRHRAPGHRRRVRHLGAAADRAGLRHGRADDRGRADRAGGGVDRRVVEHRPRADRDRDRRWGHRALARERLRVLAGQPLLPDGREDHAQDVDGDGDAAGHHRLRARPGAEPDPL